MLIDSLKENNYPHLEYVAYRGDGMPTELRRKDGSSLKSFHFDQFENGVGKGVINESEQDLFKKINAAVLFF